MTSAATASTNHERAARPRILLVRNDRIGDLVLTLPAIEALRRHLPSAHLAVLVSRYAGSLIEGHPAVDELLFDDGSQSRWQLAARLRAGRFDAALVINTNTRNCLAVAAAGIRRRICWAYKPVGYLAATERVALRRSHPPVHEADFALAFVRKLGVKTERTAPPPALPIDPAVKRRVAERIHRELGADGPLFGIHPGNKQSAYNWPAERYGQLAARLAQHGRVLVTGSPQEEAVLVAIRQHVGAANQHRVAFITDLELKELAAVIAQQSVLVVSSTGPMHLAGVVGTPTVALFSPHPAHVPAKWAPLGTNHTLLVAPLLPGENPAVPRERGTELMSRIEVEQVYRAALAAAARSPASEAA